MTFFRLGARHPYCITLPSYARTNGVLRIVGWACHGRATWGERAEIERHAFTVPKGRR